MFTPLLYGMNAGLSMSPHTIGSILMAHQRGKRQGYAFVLVGLMLDLSLIIVIYYLGNGLSFSNREQQILRIISGIITIRMGLRLFNAKINTQSSYRRLSRPFSSGFLIQIFNPNPYVFWLAIGLPHLIKAQTKSEAILFCLVFLSVTYILKVLIMEFSMKISDFCSKAALVNTRKLIAFSTVTAGCFLIIQNGKGFLS
ncbi:MAG: LysE family transporter [Pseudobdellovibrionaceae bacterium]